MADIILCIEVIETVDERLIVAEGGREIGRFARPSLAAVAWAKERRESARLRSEIEKHATWLQSMTPDQVDNLDCGTLRAVAQELRFLGQTNG